MEEGEPLTVVESFCVNCHANGETKLMLAAIPHFAEVVISSFRCEHCGYEDREVQSGAARKDYGCNIKLTVQNENDLNRQVVKSDYATLKIPAVELELPPQTQRGRCCTVEGFIREAVRGLSAASSSPELQSFVARLEGLLDPAAMPWALELDDPSGLSHVEFLRGLTPAEDSQLELTLYPPTAEQLAAMDFCAENQLPAGGLPDIEEDDREEEEDTPETTVPETETAGTEGSDAGGAVGCAGGASGEACVASSEAVAAVGDAGGASSFAATAVACGTAVGFADSSAADAADDATAPELNKHNFFLPCDRCGAPATQDCCEVEIPGFRRCMIMAFNCERCGHKSSDLKPMTGYGARGKRWTLRVEGAEDLNRDILKGSAATVIFPGLELEMGGENWGGIFTTVEGLIRKALEQLESTGQFFTGDSCDPGKRARFDAVVSGLREYAESAAARPFEVVLDDPVDWSAISARFAEHKLRHSLEHPADPNAATAAAPAAAPAGAPAAGFRGPVSSSESTAAGSQRRSETAIDDERGENCNKSENREFVLDPQLKYVVYERTNEQNDDLGLNDMVV